MKKLLFAALVLFIVNSASAQNIRGGIKVGANLSTFTNMPNMAFREGEVNVKVGRKMKFGFHIGGFVDFAFSERISLQPELLYSTQGTKFTTKMWDTEEIFNMFVSITLGYINVPVLLKVNIAEGLSAEIGPQIGFLLSAEGTSVMNGVSTSGKIKDDYNTLDVTALAGLSYTFAEYFVVSARYGLGLTYVSKANSKNSVIQLSVGYKF